MFEALFRKLWKTDQIFNCVWIWYESFKVKLDFYEVRIGETYFTSSHINGFKF